jgi:hypothetical protein
MVESELASLGTNRRSMQNTRWTFIKIAFLSCAAIVPWFSQNKDVENTKTGLELIGTFFIPTVFMSFVTWFFLNKSPKTLTHADLSGVWAANPFSRDLGLLPFLHLAAWGNLVAGVTGILKSVVTGVTVNIGPYLFGLGTTVGIIIGIRLAVYLPQTKLPSVGADQATPRN